MKIEQRAIGVRRIRITKAMVRRFCLAKQSVNCWGESHAGIRRGLEAALNGRGKRQCSPWMCPCLKPNPNKKYHNLCQNIVDGEKCYGFIKGVSDYEASDE